MNHIKARHGLKAIVLMAVLGLAVAGLSQCRMVEDTLTGVDFKANGTVSARAKCKKACDNVAKVDKKAEDVRHKAADKACGKKDKACKDAEAARSKRNNDAIKDKLEKCKGSCYNEGNGNGGGNNN